MPRFLGTLIVHIDSNFIVNRHVVKLQVYLFSSHIQSPIFSWRRPVLLIGIRKTPPIFISPPLIGTPRSCDRVYIPYLSTDKRILFFLYFDFSLEPCLTSRHFYYNFVIKEITYT